MATNDALCVRNGYRQKVLLLIVLCWNNVVNMSDNDRAVHVLSDDVHHFIRASQSIPSFHSAVEEVICNSLDAGSHRVDIYLDVDTFSFEVHDDGSSLSYYLHAVAFCYIVLCCR